MKNLKYITTSQNTALATILVLALTLTPHEAQAQLLRHLTQGVEANVEMNGVLSSGDNSPFWIASNRHGLSSIERNSGYLRAGITRGIETDSTRQWRLGYGLDIAVTANHTAPFVVQQAYGELSWKIFKVSLGSKERDIDLRNNELTSGGLSVGINARPIPQARLDIDYFSFPGTHGWWQWKMRCSYGIFTDDGWQKDFLTDAGTIETAKRTEHGLYHEKACYWKFGKEERFPLTFEIGIQMCTQFGGTIYNINSTRWGDQNEKPNGDGYHVDVYKAANGPKSFIYALLCKGADTGDGTYGNVAGNTLGSYNMRLQYHGERIRAGAYFERLFEDHSMLTLQYGIHDHLIGLELEFSKFKPLTNFVYEHLSTKDQSGPVYHDKTANMKDAIAGIDNYYNHRDYTGWQHWGMGIGNPLLTSPIYNKNGQIAFMNNRVAAHYFGISGTPFKDFKYRFVYSYSENWGTYDTPFDDKKYQTSVLGEASYRIRRHAATVKLAVGYDHGDIYKDNFGVQIGIAKHFNVSKNR